MFSLLWLAFVTLAVTGSVVYGAVVKLAENHINGFLFCFVLSIVAMAGHAAALTVYQQYHPAEKAAGWPVYGLVLAAAAGLGVVAIDLGFFYAVKYGGLILTQGVWMIAGLLLTVVMGYFLFQEDLTLCRLTGIILGSVSMFLLVWA